MSTSVRFAARLLFVLMLAVPLSSEAAAGMFRLPRRDQNRADEERRERGTEPAPGDEDDGADRAFSNLKTDDGEQLWTTGDPPYDPLPPRLADMNRYDRIAMEPYPDYDSMMLMEKAELYSRQFMYMNDRKPNFSPATLGEMEKSRSVFEVMKRMYKPPRPPAPKKKREVDMTELPGPWQAPKEPEAAAEEEEFAAPDYTVNPDGTVIFREDNRLESLRQGWNARDTVKGGR